ncbi:MAG: hypothetical protein VKQ33_15310 [Candidatus Sericytochromatia bacterium]|nr:hypothetical protein [Candidatus Sericytochromatia bacterium]
MTSRADRLGTLVLVGVMGCWTPATAVAAPLGNRPLGADSDAARSVGPGGWIVEVGASQPRIDAASTPADADEQAILGRYEELPAWPAVRLQHGLPDGNEVLARLGTAVMAGYRRPFLRADAPWGGEYLQALLQASVGYHLVSRRPVVQVMAPGIYEAGPFTLHVSGGGYYLFNDQPVVDGNAGVELRPWSWLSLGVNAHLRMDAKKMTPTDGSWSYGGGLRVQPHEAVSLQVELGQDVGPPDPAGGTPARPRIEWPMQPVRASATFAF